MVYLSDYYYVFHIKILSFLIINLVVLQILFYVPMYFFYKELMDKKFMISIFAFLFFYFFIYMFFLERVFSGMKIVNWHLTILAIVIVYSLFNYLINGKKANLQFFLFSLALFSMVWFVMVQFMTFLIYDQFQVGSFFSFYCLMLVGAPVFIVLYRFLLKRIRFTWIKVVCIGLLYYCLLLWLNLKEIMVFSFKKDFMMIVVGKNFIGRKLILEFSNRIHHQFFNLNFQIFTIMAFVIISCIPAIIVVLLLIKKQQDTEIIRLQTKREDELKKYIELIESINQETRQLQHDINNVLSSLGMYLYQEDIDSLAMRNYYDQVNQEFGLRRITRIPTGKLTYIKNPEILGLVLDKLMKAKELDIQLNLEIEKAIEFPVKGLVSIVRIIAILLDNALEESQKYPGSVVRWAFIPLSETQIVTMVENYTKNQSFISDYLAGSVQTDKGEGHGHGLKIIQSLVKENHQFSIDCKQTNQIVLFSFLVDGKR